jgi:hypothetical protein
MNPVNLVNTTRHAPLFSSEKLGTERIDIIGVGATGSKIAIELAKLGVSNIHVWDDDVVSAHNVANQFYGRQHEGMLKVDAIAEAIKQISGLEITKHPCRVEGGEALGSYVFVLPDSMKARKQIWTTSLKFKPFVKLIIETRMGIDEGVIYCFNPINPTHIKKYEATLYDDPPEEKRADLAPCGTRISVGPTATLVAGFSAWLFVQAFNALKLGKKAPPNELFFGVSEFSVNANYF